jgi:hypothetical protein
MPITQQGVAKIEELAALAARAPDGSAAVICAGRKFAMIADCFIDKMRPSERAKLRLIGRSR